MSTLQDMGVGAGTSQGTDWGRCIDTGLGYAGVGRAGVGVEGGVAVGVAGQNYTIGLLNGWVTSAQHTSSFGFPLSGCCDALRPDGFLCSTLICLSGDIKSLSSLCNVQPLGTFGVSLNGLAAQ